MSKKAGKKGNENKASLSRSSGVPRWRTALVRHELSVPSKLALAFGLYSRKETILDYGCGHGFDVKELNRRGFTARGWDPYFVPPGEKRPSDTVNLGYVLNVIEDRQERAAVLREAFMLASKRLIVAVRPQAAAKSLKEAKPYGDGVMTQTGTFQKFYTQKELAAYIADTTGAHSYLLSPGIAVVFKDLAAERDFVKIWSASHGGQAIKPYRP